MTTTPTRTTPPSIRSFLTTPEEIALLEQFVALPNSYGLQSKRDKLSARQENLTAQLENVSLEIERIESRAVEVLRQIKATPGGSKWNEAYEEYFIVRRAELTRNAEAAISTP